VPKHDKQKRLSIHILPIHQISYGTRMASQGQRGKQAAVVTGRKMVTVVWHAALTAMKLVSAHSSTKVYKPRDNQKRKVKFLTASCKTIRDKC
jgi:hypothetical protein